MQGCFKYKVWEKRKCCEKRKSSSNGEKRRNQYDFNKTKRKKESNYKSYKNKITKEMVVKSGIKESDFLKKKKNDLSKRFCSVIFGCF